MVTANLDQVFAYLIGKKLDAAKIWEWLIKQNPTVFRTEILDDIEEIGKGRPKAIRLLIESLGVMNNDVIILAIQAAYETSQTDVAHALEEGILEVCVKYKTSTHERESNDRAGVVKLLFQFLDGVAKNDESFKARREELLQQFKDKLPVSFLEITALMGTENQATDSSPRNATQLHYQRMVKTIDANYGFVLNGINLESGELGTNLVSAGYITGVDLNRILKSANPVKCLLEDYVKLKGGSWQNFLDTLENSGHESIAQFLKEEFERISLEIK